MAYYFEDHKSMNNAVGTDVKKVLEGIIYRYLGANPAHPLTYRAYCKSSIARGKDYRYEFDLNRYYPNAENEQLVYAWTKYWSPKSFQLTVAINCYGPTTVYCNGEQVFKSTFIQERYSDRKNTINIPLKAGWNHIVICFKKTRAGFGGKFGGWLGKFNLYFLMPSKEREGQEGWIFTEPMSEPMKELPVETISEADTGIKWYPELHWNESEKKLGQANRMYGMLNDAYAIGWTKGCFYGIGNHKYTVKGFSHGPIDIYIDDKQVYHSEETGDFSTEITAEFGKHDVMVKTFSGEKDWGYELSIWDGDKKVLFESPCDIKGSEEKWIYIGPFGKDSIIDLSDIKSMYSTPRGLDGEVYWRLDMPDTWVRPYNENLLFGKWNYPLGVTLYGLLHSARAVGSEDTLTYIQKHIQQCCDTFHYALWDKRQYGGATPIHELLTSIDSLDDCGSFGSVVLEVAKHLEIQGYRDIADYVADYISNKQARLEDGTFYRKNLMHTFHEDTLWADDLYMSVPFLCRYYQLTGDEKYINDAAHQFLGFKRFLYMPEQKIMSHVYDFKHQMATRVPWGRGNGWVVFSLSELLAVLPENHEKRNELLAMFKDLCEGYKALQDENGMWHQVLNDWDSYPETSCTSMFIYAFSRGIRYGWLDPEDGYAQAVIKAWEALTKVSIDRFGNVHGVCRGSEFSFTPDYYKYELLWNLNDTHGIGIVLLAGVEVLRLFESLR